MKIKKLLKEEAGSGDLILSSILLLVSLLNLIHGIYIGGELHQYFLFVGPYFISAIMIFICGWKMCISYLLLLIAVLTTYDTELLSDLSGAFFFCISAYMIKKNKYNIFVLILTIILLTLRSMKLEDTIPGTITIILGYFALYALFYFIVYRPCVKPLRDKEKLLNNFTDQEKQLIKLLRSGETQKTAGHIMSLPPNGANDMLKKLKKESGCKTTIEFFSNL